MDPNARRPERREKAVSSLNMAIETLNLAKEISSITPAKAVFGSVSVILVMIRDSMVNKEDYVELGMVCVNVCTALNRGLSGKRLEDLNNSVCEAIKQLTTTVAEIQRKVIKQGKRNIVSRLLHAKSDKDTITAWRSDLNGILLVFNTELALNTNVVLSDTHTVVSDVHRGVASTHAIVSDIHTIVKNLGGAGGQNPSTQTSISGESPPPPPRIFFGRNDLIEKIVGFTGNLTPTALIGVGGIGKTSIALAVLHDDRIKERFGDHRRFIRCDQFPASPTHFLHRLSKVIGAGAETPEDLAPLRPFLSSKKILIVLDNVESILDPRGTNSQEIYALVEELSQLETVCLCVTSRISTVPPDCKTLDVPTLSMESARDTFYRICDYSEQPDLVNNILKQLDFHPLSITLLATVAHHNKWDTDRMAREWEKQRTGLLHTQHNKSLAATIELSLASPMFQELGPDARDILGVVAFFPRGINENNIDWLFPAISDRTNIFDKFCILSLTYRNGGFITMLAPLRDHLCPKDPKLSPLLGMTKKCYFSRLSVDIFPGKPGYEEARWIVLEDVNVEHLLDVFTSIDGNFGDVWDACRHFMQHLEWHKPRLITLGAKIEGLLDDHRSKPGCMFRLSQLLHTVGKHDEAKQLLIQTLKLWRERGDDLRVAEALRFLADTNRMLCLPMEGILQAEEAVEISERLDNVLGQANSLKQLAWLLQYDQQYDAAEAAASRAIDLLSDEGEQFEVCECHTLLGAIRGSKGMMTEAINHYEAALRIASSFNWPDQQFLTLFSLASLFLDQQKFDDANVHIERAKSHAVNNPYDLCCAMNQQAWIWYREGRLEEAKSEALRAIVAFEDLGVTNKEAELCGDLLREIEAGMNPVVSDDAQGTEALVPPTPLAL